VLAAQEHRWPIVNTAADDIRSLVERCLRRAEYSTQGERMILSRGTVKPAGENASSRDPF
jgi:hypothetical protein